MVGVIRECKGITTSQVKLPVQYMRVPRMTRQRGGMPKVPGIERKIWEIGPQNVYFPAISREIAFPGK